MHRGGGQEVQQVTESHGKFFVGHVVDVKFNVEEFNHGGEVVERFSGQCRARLNQLNRTSFNVVGVNRVNDCYFNGLSVGRQLQSVIRDINKFSVEDTQLLHAISRHVVQELVD